MQRPKQEDVSDWYIETIKKAELFDYGPFKGSIIIREYGFAIWELIQEILGPMIKSLGCKNVYFPSLIPEEYLRKEKEHVEGFSPECAVVTHAGGKKLEEPLVVRPTSETIMYSLFSKWISSWRDLPLRINQWVNIVRWEKRPFPFLRTSEFLWQEGHTVHASEEESDQQVLDVLKIYKSFFEDFLAIPVILGKKTDREKFAGAAYSTSCETLLIDGKGLQIATAHNLGQNFSIAFDINFLDDKGQRKTAWQTSWGISTRAIGGIILTHGDEKGLIFPPKVAPIQVVVVPIWKNDSDRVLVSAKANLITEELKAQNIRVEFDGRDQFKPGWKFNEWELRGVPLRIEIGPKDIANNQIVLSCRDSGEKITVVMEEMFPKVSSLLDEIQQRLFVRAQHFVRENTFYAKNFDEFFSILESKRGFIEAPWCGDSECEKRIKEQTKATTRCIPFEMKKVKDTCIRCDRPSTLTPIWARAH